MDPSELEDWEVAEALRGLALRMRTAEATRRMPTKWEAELVLEGGNRLGRYVEACDLGSDEE